MQLESMNLTRRQGQGAEKLDDGATAVMLRQGYMLVFVRFRVLTWHENVLWVAAGAPISCVQILLASHVKTQQLG